MPLGRNVSRALAVHQSFIILCKSQECLSRYKMCIFLPSRIDRKMSSSQTNYKLDEAQAIFNELRSIKKAISTGEKERQDLIQVSLFSPSSLKIMLTC